MLAWTVPITPSPIFVVPILTPVPVKLDNIRTRINTGEDLMLYLVGTLQFRVALHSISQTYTLQYLSVYQTRC